MSSVERHVARSGSLATKEQLKLAAQTLFGRHGIEAVTVQQIVEAAGQRNNASLHYHFGSKDELVRQLVVDGARQLDSRRHEMLQSMEAAGGPRNVREVLEILVLPVVELGDHERWRGYIRFISNLQLSNRDKLRSALAGQWNTGYVECLNKLRQLLSPMPQPLLEQKLSFLGIYANAVLTAREAAQELHRDGPHQFWSGPYTLENIMDTLEATLTCEPSAATLAQLARVAGHSDRNRSTPQS